MASIFLAIGHGITTEGTWDCGCADGVYTEAALMKPIVGASIDILKEHGVYVVTDYPENDMNMVECVASANSYGVDLYVSYHCDYYKAPSGTLPIVHSSSDSGYRAAEKINNRVMSIMGIGTNGIKKRDDYEVTYTNMPAVIFETGSIRADIYKLQQADVYGKAIAIGILDYFGISYKGGDVSADPAPSPGGGTQFNFTSIYDSNNYLEYGDGPSNNIGQFQRDCQICGYWGENGPLAIDNLYGSECVHACECIQRFHGLEIDGKYGRLTDLALMKEVATIQAALNKFGYNLTVDGASGPATVNALKDFQAKHGLVMDGIVGQQTQAKLGL